MVTFSCHQEYIYIYIYISFCLYLLAWILICDNRFIIVLLRHSSVIVLLQSLQVRQWQQKLFFHKPTIWDSGNQHCFSTNPQSDVIVTNTVLPQIHQVGQWQPTLLFYTHFKWDNDNEHCSATNTPSDIVTTSICTFFEFFQFSPKTFFIWPMNVVIRWYGTCGNRQASKLYIYIYSIFE